MRSALLLALAGCASPSAPPVQTVPYECRWASVPLTIDGAADEAAWKDAVVIDRFMVSWLGREARTATRARLLWDREYFYFFADMDDADLYADVKEHDGMTWLNDVFEIFLKPAAAKPGYYEFQVNAANAGMDMLLPRRGAGGYPRFKSEGEFAMKHAVRLRGTINHWPDRDSGWSVEGRIAWSGFQRTGGAPSPGDVWTFALCRYDYSVDFEGPELSTSAPLAQPSFHRFEDYAPLRFAGPTTQSR